ncbi:hypothetical protein OIU76_020247 [Salix suchowensis]|uniref:ALOG domain-containing protein n=1 Tax=Salix suchowensis TaxID=1278906 RepID=A0ABQ8ZLV7_9ROSI|nr:hypothetical protein OIU76_020247 [Salix suchowensis]KAJ6302721.1 hypothetical protein OIU77_016749 [Salix suchowensis]KAJ6315326.1 hypothetical protein OIU78_018752 [Salix suchowensis]
MDSTSGGTAAPDPSSGEPGPSAAAAGSSSASDQPRQKPEGSSPPAPPSRYESQKRRDWNTFLQYLKNHKPPLTLARCSGAHVIEFLKYLDQFGKTKVHITSCPYFGHSNPPAPCSCQFKQAWGSLDALIGRLRAAYDENGGLPESNPFGARAVRIYLREVREGQAKARGIPYEKKKRKRPNFAVAAASVSVEAAAAGSNSGGGEESGGGDNSAAATTAAAATTTV